MILKPEIVDHKNFVKILPRLETKHIVVHCSATENKPEYGWKAVDRWHRQQGWLMCGYHFVIRTDGTIEKGRDLEAIGSHVKGHNDNSVGICLIGGLDSNGKSVDNFTTNQYSSLRALIDYLLSVYMDSDVLGHRDFANVAKDCPCFDVKSWYGIPPKYIQFTTWEDLEEVCKTPKSYLKALNGDTLEFEYGETIRVA